MCNQFPYVTLPLCRYRFSSGDRDEDDEDLAAGCRKSPGRGGSQSPHQIVVDPEGVKKTLFVHEKTEERKERGVQVARASRGKVNGKATRARRLERRRTKANEHDAG